MKVNRLNDQFDGACIADLSEGDNLADIDGFSMF